MTDYATDRIHVLRVLEPTSRRPTGHVEDVPHAAEGVPVDPDFAWLEEIALSEGPPDEVVQAGGVAVVVRRREALRAYERALHAARDPARDRTRDFVLDTDEEIEAAAVRIARDRG